MRAPRLSIVTSLLAAVLTAAAGVAGTSGAVASGPFPVQVNVPNTVMTANNNPSIRINLAGGGFQTVTCAVITMPAQINPAGVITLPVAGAAFNGCVLAAGAAVVARAGAAGGGNVKHLHAAVGGAVTGITADVTIPGNGITVTRGGCAFTLGGTPLGEYIPPFPGMHGVPFNVPSITFPAPLDAFNLDLTTAGVNAGCAPLNIVNNLQARLTATFQLNPAVNGMAVLP